MTVLPAIAAKLAGALQHMPCRCIKRDQWPWKEPKTCQRCDALAAYDAFVSIVQVPAMPAKDQP